MGYQQLVQELEALVGEAATPVVESGTRQETVQESLWPQKSNWTHIVFLVLFFGIKFLADLPKLMASVSNRNASFPWSLAGLYGVCLVVVGRHIWVCIRNSKQEIKATN